jgi:hypothetical protein
MRIVCICREYADRACRWIVAHAVMLEPDDVVNTNEISDLHQSMPSKSMFGGATSGYVNTVFD